MVARLRDEVRMLLRWIHGAFYPRLEVLNANRDVVTREGTAVTGGRVTGGRVTGTRALRVGPNAPA